MNKLRKIPPGGRLPVPISNTPSLINYGLAIVSESILGNDDGIELFASEEENQIMFRPALEVEFTLV